MNDVCVRDVMSHEWKWKWREIKPRAGAKPTFTWSVNGCCFYFRFNENDIGTLCYKIQFLVKLYFLINITMAVCYNKV